MANRDGLQDAAMALSAAITQVPSLNAAGGGYAEAKALLVALNEDERDALRRYLAAPQEDPTTMVFYATKREAWADGYDAGVAQGRYLAAQEAPALRAALLALCDAWAGGGWSGDYSAMERAYEAALAALTPPTPAEPPRADEPVHVHVAGAGEGGAICADCGHDFRERCHARLLDETPYRCGGPQTGQPKPHTACNCTPRAEARPPEGLDALTDRLAAVLPDALSAMTEGGDETEAPEPSDEPGSPYVMGLAAYLAARLSAGGAE